MAEDLTRISASKKDIYDRFLTIASKYTDVENSDFLKSGLFGYITESAAMMARDSAIHKSMLYNESFLNTAIMPKSIYNWAKMFNIDVTKAKPAYAEVSFTIPLDSVSEGSIYMQRADTLYAVSGRKYGADLEGKGKSEVVVFDKSTPIIAGDYYFHLEHSILLTHFIGDNTDSYIAQYILSEETTTSYQHLDSQILETSIEDENLIIKARAYQYNIEVKSKQVSSSSFLNTKIHSFEFEDQYAGARLFYTPSGGETEEVKLLFSEIRNTQNTKFAYYNLVNSNELEIRFSSEKDGFIPAANSTLRLEVYTTKGDNVPSLYSDNAVFKLEAEELRSFPVIATFDPQDIIGGSSAPSLNEIKKTIISEISTRNAIITEADLNKYFAILTALLESINGGKLTFIRERDDILKRCFNAYILLRHHSDGTDPSYIGDCIPTNTIDARFEIEENMSKPFGVALKWDKTLKGYQYVPEVRSLTDNDYFIIPFYTRVVSSPFKRVKYLYNLSDDSAILTYSKDYEQAASSSNTIVLIPSTVSIQRGVNEIVSNMREGSSKFEAEPFYTLKMNFTSNKAITQDTLNLDSQSGMALNVYNKNSSLISATFKDFSNGNFRIYSEDKANNSENNKNIVFEFKIPVKSDDEFTFSSESGNSNYGTLLNIESQSSVYRLTDNAKFELVLNDFSIEGEIVNGRFISGSELSLFRDMDDIADSDIDYEYKKAWVSGSSVVDSIPENPEGYSPVKLLTHVKIYGIPVIHASYFTDISDSTEGRHTKIIKEIFSYIDLLKENLGKLETNTYFNMKFYNTYGTSNFYDTPSVNIRANIQITLKNTGKDAVLEDTIRDKIRRAVDVANDNQEIKFTTKVFVDLMNDSNLRNFIDDIQGISLNDTNNWSITRNKNIAENEYPPEWLNINRDTLAEDITFIYKT